MVHPPINLTAATFFTIFALYLQFTPDKPLSSDDNRYIKNPSEGEKTHCLVCVVSANHISLMTGAAIDRMKMALEEANKLGKYYPKNIKK